MNLVRSRGRDISQYDIYETVEKLVYSSSKALRSREVSQMFASRQARRITFGYFSTVSFTQQCSPIHSILMSRVW